MLKNYDLDSELYKYTLFVNLSCHAIFGFHDCLTCASTS